MDQYDMEAALQPVVDLLEKILLQISSLGVEVSSLPPETAIYDIDDIVTRLDNIESALLELDRE